MRRSASALGKSARTLELAISLAIGFSFSSPLTNFTSSILPGENTTEKVALSLLCAALESLRVRDRLSFVFRPEIVSSSSLEGHRSFFGIGVLSHKS